LVFSQFVLRPEDWKMFPSFPPGKWRDSFLNKADRFLPHSWKGIIR
jgi:hypothetical protein